MHILFLSDNFPPEVNAPASRTFEHCREWVAAGHKVTVVTGAPNFPKGEVFAGYRNRLWSKETVAGIEVIRVWTYITRNEGFVRRSLDFISFMVTAFVASFFVRKPDVVVGTSPQFFTACAAFGVGLTRRRPWVFELRDLWPESIRAVTPMKTSPLLDALEWLELQLYRKASAVVAVTEAFREDLTRRGIEGSKIHVVTNGVDLGRFQPMPRDEALARSLGLQGRFVVGYIGTHGLAHGLDTLLDAARLLAQEEAPVSFLFLGDGAERSRLVERARDEGLANAIFLETVSKEDVPRYWSLLDAPIVHLKKDELFKSVIPSKIFECMAMGLPILHGVEGESAEIVTRHEVGLTFEPGNAHQLADRVRTMMVRDDERERLAANGPVAAAMFDRRALAGRMMAILREVAGEERR